MIDFKKKVIILLTLLLFAQSQHLHAQLPEGFTDEAIDGSWDIPVGITFDKEGFGYLWTSTGKVYFIDENDQISSDPVLDISEEAASWLDHGMLGFALDPDFRENGLVYLLYPVDRHHLIYYNTPEYNPSSTTTHQATIGRLTRYRLDLTSAQPFTIPDSRKVLVGATADDGFPIYSDNHGIGGIAFGNDGTLLVSCGDSASSTRVDSGNNDVTDFSQALQDDILTPAENVGAFKSQLINCLNGKLIRIDPETGAGLPSNPFYDAQDPFSAQSRVWVVGLRNPWRVTHVPESGSHLAEEGQPGHFIIGDVGEGTWEEINLITEGGQNFGWPMYEGFESHPEYSSRYTPNYNAPNPLSGQDGCPGFFNFQTLLVPADQQSPRLNPCDGESPIAESPHLFRHQPPLIVYQNQSDESSPYTMVASTDASGLPIHITVEEAGIGEHFQGDASMAGIFYKSDQFPERYHGKYFHADYRGWIRVMDYNDGVFTRIDTFHQASEKIVSLAENPGNGALYYINLEDKKLHKVSYGGPPISVIKVSSSQPWGPAPLTVSFDASESYNAESPLSFNWDFGNGQTGEGNMISHTFNNISGLPESFEVILSVQDTFGQIRERTIPVSINNAPPEVRITYPADSMLYPTDGTNLIRLEADVSDTENEPSELNYEWEVFLHHNDHFHPSSSSQEKEAYALISPLGCHQTDTYWYRVILTVTDPQGGKQSDESLIFPACANPFVTFTAFTARVYGEYAIDLNWRVASNGLTEYFEIQRSTDFLHFDVLARVDGNASYLGAVDVQPLNGTNIYRIKAVAPDGSIRYSPLEAVSYPPDFNYTVYPNPATERITIDIDEAQADIISLRIYNTMGQLLQTQNTEAIYGEAFNHELSIDQLPVGIFYLVVENGKKRIVEKILKK